MKTSPTKSILFLLAIFTVLIGKLQAQNLIKGKVIDAKTAEAMPFANVYISNSSVATQTDEKGNYQLYNIPEGDVSLVVSYVGYTLFQKILNLKSGQTMQLDVQIVQSGNILSEIEVKSKRDKSWERNLKTFKLAFLGQNYTDEKCKILNEWVIDFKDENGILKASSQLPIEIENKGLGYNLFYDLKEFSQSKDKTVYLGATRFKEMSSKNINELKKWLENRGQIYQRSPERFLKSLYKNTLLKDGYLVYAMANSEWESGSSPFQIAQNLIENNSTLLLGNNVQKVLKLNYPIEIINQKLNNNNVGRMRMNSALTEIMEDGWINNPRAIEMGKLFANQRVGEMLPREFGTNYDEESGTLKNEFVKTYLHLNKTGFISGETIWLSAYVLDSKNILYRKIAPLYLQLYDLNGIISSEQTLFTSNGRGVGYIKTSDSLASGVYRLRAFTREMLNVPSSIFEKEIVIQNVKSDFLVKREFKKWINEASESLNLTIETDKKQYEPHEKIKVKLKLRNANNEAVTATFSSSVVDGDHSIEDIEDFNISSFFSKTNKNSQVISSDFSYEPNMSISGTAIDNSTGKIIQKAKLALIFTDPEKYFTRIVETDSKGKFRITDLDFVGENVLVYQVNSNKDKSIENGYIIFEKFPYPITLSKMEYSKEAILFENKAINDWISQNPSGIIYELKKEIKAKPVKVEKELTDAEQQMVGVPKIYNEPDFAVNFDKPMNFKNVYEMLQGNLPGVRVDQINEVYKVFVRGIGSWNTDRLDPLFLLDGIETYDLKFINPNEVIRIELLSGPKAAIFGMRGANGVIAIYTRRFGERKAGFQYAKSKIVSGFQKEVEFFSPDYSKIKPLKDQRTSVYWNPEIILDKNGEAEFSFYAADVPAGYKITVEGMTLFGQVCRAEKVIEIK
jgi:CarboxypepD_reg-like domain/TonB-dependent Receptor Plug Domain